MRQRILVVVLAAFLAGSVADTAWAEGAWSATSSSACTPGSRC